MPILRSEFGLYAIANLSNAHRLDTVWANAVLAAGCSSIQLRAKHLDDIHLVTDAHLLKRLASDHDTPFVVNDRADIAALVEADALHIGQDDVPIEQARKVVKNMPIGVSTHSLEQALDAERAGADHIGFGPVFTTHTKANPDPTVGTNQLEQVCAAIGIPVVAIGGINLQNAIAAYEAGACCVAVISAIGGDATAASNTVSRFQKLFMQTRSSS